MPRGLSVGRMRCDPEAFGSMIVRRTTFGCGSGAVCILDNDVKAVNLSSDLWGRNAVDVKGQVRVLTIVASRVPSETGNDTR